MGAAEFSGGFDRQVGQQRPGFLGAKVDRRHVLGFKAKAPQAVHPDVFRTLRH